MLRNYIIDEVAMVSPGASLQEVAQLMREKNVGSVIIVDDKKENPRPKGIITDRDITTQLIAGKKKLDAIVEDYATEPVFTVSDSQDLFETIDAMEERGVRRAPVVDRDNKIIGIVTLDDLVVAMIDQLQHLGNIIKKQLNHRYH